MGGATENCRSEPRDLIYIPADSLHNHKRKGTGIRVRGNEAADGCVHERSTDSLKKGAHEDTYRLSSNYYIFNAVKAWGEMCKRLEAGEITELEYVTWRDGYTAKRRVG